MILIVGGTGALGSAAARLFLQRGQQVRIMTRDPRKAQAVESLGAEVVPGDLRDKPSLERACEKTEVVLAAAHSIMGRGPEASQKVDSLGHKWLINAAEAAGVHHFIYTSAFGASPTHPAAFYRIKYEVEQYLQHSRLAYTILRPTAFMDSHAHMLIGQPILENGKVSLFGRGGNPRNLVSAQDVAQFALEALENSHALDDIIEIGGPENWTAMDIVRLYEQFAGRRAKVSHVPLALLRLMAPVLRPFHPGLSQVMTSSIWFETTDQTFEPRPTLQKYPLPLTKLEDWVQAKVGQPPVPQYAF
jgi:uncharacterized protein YbjT (DUF2867 family)